jgi:Helix-turn-helix domain
MDNSSSRDTNSSSGGSPCSLSPSTSSTPCPPPSTSSRQPLRPTTANAGSAARSLGIGRTKAYQLARTGEFPCRIIRVGTGYLVPPAELLKVLGVTPPGSPEAVTRQQPTTA